MSKQITTQDVLDAGVHFGHQTKRWNPKMKRFILTKKNGLHIIDPAATIDGINTVYEYVTNTVAKGGTVLFVGTKKQAQNSIVDAANRVGMPYVTERWLGGMITNFETISKRLGHLTRLETIDYDSPNSSHTKKELLLLRREKDKLEKVLGGIKSMKRVPDAVFVVDSNKEHLAVKEAKKLNIPVIAIADTNCNPDDFDYAIPGNDDAIASIRLITDVVADAVANGIKNPIKVEVEVKADEATNASVPTPLATEELADWEKELLNS